MHEVLFHWFLSAMGDLLGVGFEAGEAIFRFVWKPVQNLAGTGTKLERAPAYGNRGLGAKRG